MTPRLQTNTLDYASMGVADDLLRSALEGGEGNRYIGEIIQILEPQIRAIIRTKYPDWNEDEIFSDWQLKFFRNFQKKYDISRDFGPWIRTMLENCIRDHFRTRTNGKGSMLAYAGTAVDCETYVGNGTGLPSADDVLEIRDAREFIQQRFTEILDTLSEQQREIMELIGAGNSQNQVATLLGIKISRVKSTIALVKRRVRGIHNIEEIREEIRLL